MQNAVEGLSESEKQERCESIRKEIFRMECAYDNLHTDSGLYAAYQSLWDELRELEK